MTPETKRVWFPRTVVLSGVATVGFMAVVMPLRVLWFPVLGALIVTYFNLHGTNICGSCGAANYRYRPPYPIKYCKKCSAELR